jgi:flagellar biosynthesis/type III secretory pathway protein FliH
MEGKSERQEGRKEGRREGRKEGKERKESTSTENFFCPFMTI